MTIKILINKVHRGVDYVIEVDINSIRTIKKIDYLMEKAERFIDRILDGDNGGESKCRI